MALTQISTDGIKNQNVNTNDIANDSINMHKLQSSSVTRIKIATNAVDESKILNQSVTTNKIADEAVTLAKLEHGTSSNDGKFLRANNGADPSFETLSIPAGTTINSNADNRVITGSGTANTLNGESNLTYNGSNLALSGNDNQYITIGASADLTLKADGSNSAIVHNGDGDLAIIAQGTDENIKFQSAGYLRFLTNGGNERARIDSTGNTHFGSSGTLSGADTVSIVPSEGRISYGMDGRDAFVTGENGAYIYSGSGVGGTMPAGDLILQSRSNQNRTIRFVTGSSPAQRMSIDSAGLKFGTDTSTANALNDYEQGTWTPTMNATGTLTVHSAHYVKVGNKVTFQAYITFPSMASGSSLRVQNFPFDVAGNSDYHSFAVNSSANLGVGSGKFQLVGQFNKAAFAVFAKPSNVKATISEMSGTFVLFSCTIVTF